MCPGQPMSKGKAMTELDCTFDQVPEQVSRPACPTTMLCRRATVPPVAAIPLTSPGPPSVPAVGVLPLPPPPPLLSAPTPLFAIVGLSRSSSLPELETSSPAGGPPSHPLPPVLFTGPAPPEPRDDQPRGGPASAPVAAGAVHRPGAARPAVAAGAGGVVRDRDVPVIAEDVDQRGPTGLTPVA